MASERTTTTTTNQKKKNNYQRLNGIRWNSNSVSVSALLGVVGPIALNCTHSVMNQRWNRIENMYTQTQKKKEILTQHTFRF